MSDAFTIAGYLAGITGVVTAVFAGIVSLKKAKAEVATEEKKLTQADAKEAFVEAKQAWSKTIDLLIENVKAMRLELNKTNDDHKKSQEKYADDLKTASEKHHRCELEMATVKGDMKVMQVELDRLKDHDKRNGAGVEMLKNTAIKQLSEKVVLDTHTPKVETEPFQECCGQCSKCGRGIGKLDASVGDGLCALCRIDKERSEQ